MELTIVPCEHCGKTKRMMVKMVPGKDGAPWSLCPRCWEDGLKPTRVTVTTTTEGTSYMPERAGGRDPTDPPGLVAHQYTETTTKRVLVDQATAKNDVGSFERPKAKTKRRAAR